MTALLKDGDFTRHYADFAKTLNNLSEKLLIILEFDLLSAPEIIKPTVNKHGVGRWAMFNYSHYMCVNFLSPENK